MGEPRFAGAGRVRLVDDLVGLFRHRVVEEQAPTWVSIEGPTGWGKSRVVQEFYKRLAAEDQPRGAYWPPSIIDACGLTDEELDLPETRRNRVHPSAMQVPEDVMLPWLWWGLTAGSRSGIPVDALTGDLELLQPHLEPLEVAWQQRTSRTDRFLAVLRPGPTAGSSAGWWPRRQCRGSWSWPMPPFPAWGC